MLITLQDAAIFLQMSESGIYHIKELKAMIIKTGDGNRIEERDLRGYVQRRDEQEHFCYEMTSLSEYVISQIGEKRFYSHFGIYKSANIKSGIKNSKLGYTDAQRVYDAYASEWEDRFAVWRESEEDIEAEYLPLEDRKPLDFSFVSTHYWNGKKTLEQIASELNVPQSWVYTEIRQLGMGKKECGIKHRGRLGYKMPEDEKIKHHKQPHAKPVSQIDPVTFEIVAQYRSIAATAEAGFTREHVKRAVQRANLSRGYLWAEQGYEHITIAHAKAKGTLDKKLKAAKAKKPTRAELQKLYSSGLKNAEIAQIIGCHTNTVAQYALQHGIKKRAEHITIEQLKHCYIDRGMTAQQIADEYGYSDKSISTYLSRNGIKRRTA